MTKISSKILKNSIINRDEKHLKEATCIDKENKISKDHQKSGCNFYKLLKKPILLIFVGVILFLLIFFVFLKKSTQLQKKETSSVLQESSLINTEEWQTFRSIRHGFSINYPRSWGITQIYSAGGILGFSSKQRSSYPDVAIHIFENEDYLDLNNFLDISYSEVEGLEINEKDAIKYAVSQNDFAERVAIDLGGEVFVISKKVQPEEKIDQHFHRIFQEMVKSIVFLEKESPLTESIKNEDCESMIQASEIDILSMNVERNEDDYLFKLNGRIRGDYCFEGFCKYGVFDADNHLLLSDEFEAGGDWTIRDHIPFSIDFLSNDELIDDGTIVIQSTNPSLLSKNSGCFSLPVFLQDSLLNNQAVHLNYQYGISFFYPISFHASGAYWSYPIETTPLALGNEGVWMFFDNQTFTKEKINELKEDDVVKTEPDDSATQMIYQKSSQNIANDLIEGYLIEKNPGKNHYQPAYGLSYVIKLRDGTYISLNLSSMYEETLQSWKDEFGQIISTTRYIDGE